jgi:hypothetical protein
MPLKNVMMLTRGGAIAVFFALVLGCESNPTVVVTNSTPVALHMQIAEPGPRHNLAMFYSPRDYEFFLPASRTWSSAGAKEERVELPLQMRGGVIVLRLRSSTMHHWATFACRIDKHAVIVVEGMPNEFMLTATDEIGSPLELKASTADWFR